MYPQPGTQAAGRFDPHSRNLQQPASAPSSSEDATTNKPLTLSVQGLRPLAPLQRVTVHHKRSIAGYLTVTEATRLGLTSKDLNLAVHQHELLRLSVISNDFAELGCNRLIHSLQTTDAEIAALRLDQQRGGDADGTDGPRTKGGRSLTVAGHRFNLNWPGAKQRQASALQASALSTLREKEAQRTEAATQLDAMVPDIERVVFHIASARRDAETGTKSGAVNAPRDFYERMKLNWAKIHQAVENGEVELVRSFMREFLSLSPRLVSNEKKVEWLREPKGAPMLPIMARRCCGTLKEPERRLNEAIGAYVEEIVGSQYMSVAEKIQICLKLQAVHRDWQTGHNNRLEVDLVRYAYDCSNAAIAASVLLGIYRSAAEPTIKSALLTTAASAWDGGLRACTNEVGRSLTRYRHRAEDWVDERLTGLKLMAMEYGGEPLVMPIASSSQATPGAADEAQHSEHGEPTAPSAHPTPAASSPSTPR